MRLREIELRNWRGLSQSLAVLSPRLNLILGPNESGKSRIFQALQFGLFETYKGTSQRKQALQSWISAEPPFVRIAFTDGEVDYELQKQFLKGAAAQLTGGGQVLRGEEAEESLRQILGTRQPGNRGAAIDDRGIWPLIMVSQGESRAPVQEHLNEDGRGRLQDRLSREIGVAAISPRGQRVMSLVEAEYQRYFTATGQEGKALRDARGALREAQDRLAAATESLQRQEKAAQGLETNRLELAELQARRASARAQADSARDRAEAAQVAGRLMATAQGVLDTNVQKASSARDALSARQQADATIQRLTDELVQLESAAAQRPAAHHELEEAARLAERRFVEVERQQRRTELTNLSQDLGTRIAGLEQLDVAIADARAARARLPPMDAASLSRLKQLDQFSRAASAQLQGAAVNVVVHLKLDAVIDGIRRVAGEAIQIHVVDNQRIAIGGLADVEIRPGGGELERLRQAAAAATAQLQAALRAAGTENLAYAIEIHDERVACEQQITELGKQAKATSSRSLAQLREDLTGCLAELERLGPAGTAPLDDIVRVTTERDGAAAALAEFRNNMIALRSKLETLRGERERFVSQYAGRPTAAQLQEVLDAGARGFLLKSDAARDLVSAVEALRLNRIYFTPRVASMVLDGYLQRENGGAIESVERNRLTPREREIVQLLAEGKSSKEVATVLGLSVKTAETHRSNIMRKLELHSVSDLVLYAVRNNIVHIQPSF